MDKILYEKVKAYRAWANGNLENYTFRNGQQCVIPCSPLRFESQMGNETKPGPLPGEHTCEILKELEYTDQVYLLLLEMESA